MRPLVVMGEGLALWAKHIGDKDLMRSRVVTPEEVYHWAKHHQEYELMWPLIYMNYLKGNTYRQRWITNKWPTFGTTTTTDTGRFSGLTRNVSNSPKVSREIVCKYCNGTGKWLSPGGFGTYYDCKECEFKITVSYPILE